MTDLVEATRQALSETWSFYFKAHSFHWNVEGIAFPYLHSFFESIYTDAHSASDDIAERLRTIKAYAPESLTDIQRLATIKFSGIPSAAGMVDQLSKDNDKVITALKAAYEAAEEADNCGLSNFFQDRLDKHAKWGWMLRATSK